MTVDTRECLMKGAIGSLGAIPGTVCAHPFDLTKIRMQVKSNLRFETALRQTFVRGPMAGVSSGISQKILTRGPMFFTSELCTQACQKYIGLSRDYAIFVGSCCSGYATGFIAAPSEWAKVQIGTQQQKQQQAQQHQYRYRSSIQNSAAIKLVTSSVRNGQTKPLIRRMHAAGLRNSVFDCTFFGTEHFLSSYYHLPKPLSFALGAIIALVIDYPLDVVVKRSMATPPNSFSNDGLNNNKCILTNCGPIKATYRFVINDCKCNVFQLYSGIGCKVMEFSTSYFVTGMVAPFIVRGFTLILASTASLYSPLN